MPQQQQLWASTSPYMLYLGGRGGGKTYGGAVWAVSRPRKSVGGERTFGHDLSSGPALREALDGIVDVVWERIERAEAKGRTVTLKLKHVDFTLLTRARSLAQPVAGKAEFAKLGHGLLDEVLPLAQPVRLMGLTLSALEGERNEAAEGQPDGQLSLL